MPRKGPYAQRRLNIHVSFRGLNTTQVTTQVENTTLRLRVPFCMNNSVLQQGNSYESKRSAIGYTE